jgi:hypothetical protein
MPTANRHKVRAYAGVVLIAVATIVPLAMVNRAQLEIDHVQASIAWLDRESERRTSEADGGLQDSVGSSERDQQIRERRRHDAAMEIFRLHDRIDWLYRIAWIGAAAGIVMSATGFWRMRRPPGRPS